MAKHMQFYTPTPVSSVNMKIFINEGLNKICCEIVKVKQLVNTNLLLVPDVTSSDQNNDKYSKVMTKETLVKTQQPGVTRK